MCSIMGFSKKSRSKEEVAEYFDRTLSRGPDMTRILETPTGWLCFHRLAIMGLDERGMQPFTLGEDMVVCNGELYGWREMKRELEGKYTFQSESDCELLLPLYREYGLGMFEKLDAEFALILYDGATGSLVAARDPIGIRPLFYGYDYDGGIVFASEAKNLPVQDHLPLPAWILLRPGQVRALRRSHHRGAVQHRRSGDRVP